ncbi:hypothetical protein [Sphingobacterium mizutaii]|uniref:hypothetical protein n=1 Tax=Sphingobacterium mizutaii TaxID=1010 RepID=UPI001628C4A6|nr:hypothetical protein [Sphingobacterium mizutaii]
MIDSERSVRNLYCSPSPKHCHPLPKVKELYANAIIICMVPRTFVPQVDNLKEHYHFAILKDQLRICTVPLPQALSSFTVGKGTVRQCNYCLHGPENLRASG